MTTAPLIHSSVKSPIKVVVWDADLTMLDGILTENPNVSVRAHVRNEIVRLDSLGVLQSIVSRNDFYELKAVLEKEGLWEYFLYPQIRPDYETGKSGWVEEIAARLNLGLDSFMVIDDQIFERIEIATALADKGPVTVVDIVDIGEALQGLRFPQEPVTEEARNRRKLYQATQMMVRDREEFLASGRPLREFRATLDATFTFWKALPNDLIRSHDLLDRVHQLNTTGKTYGREELQYFSSDSNHLLLMASLTDKYAIKEQVENYGTIGMALLKIDRELKRMYLLIMLMSCRVLNHGAGTVMLDEVIHLGHKAGMDELHANFARIKAKGNSRKPRNWQMSTTYNFIGLRSTPRDQWDDEDRRQEKELKQQLDEPLVVYSAKLDQLAQLSESRRSGSAIKVSMQDDIISFISGDSFRKPSS